MGLMDQLERGEHEYENHTLVRCPWCGTAKMVENLDRRYTCTKCNLGVGFDSEGTPIRVGIDWRGWLFYIVLLLVFALWMWGFMTGERCGGDTGRICSDAAP